MNMKGDTDTKESRLYGAERWENNTGKLASISTGTMCYYYINPLLNDTLDA